MKLFGFVIFILLVIIAVQTSRIPTAIEIGEGILAAQDAREARIYKARLDSELRASAEIARASREHELQKKQAEFDALSKWDSFGRPINREPPAGLHPTADIPPSPVATPRPPIIPRRTPTPAEQAADIEKRFK